MLIIYSGGMDSTTLLHEYRKNIKLAVSFDYGSKHKTKELESAKYFTKKLNIEHIVIDVEKFFSYFKSDLLKTGGEIPEGHYAAENMKRTIVPFRNGIMLSISAGLAQSRNLKKILIANHYGDHAIYPDCRKGFIDSMNRAVIEGTDGNVSICAPYTLKTKREIALIGKKLGVEHEKTWSCYKGGDVHCGRCGTCIERIEALEGFDKTQYIDKEYYKKVLK